MQPVVKKQRERKGLSLSVSLTLLSLLIVLPIIIPRLIWARARARQLQARRFAILAERARRDAPPTKLVDESHFATVGFQPQPGDTLWAVDSNEALREEMLAEAKSLFRDDVAYDDNTIGSIVGNIKK